MSTFTIEDLKRSKQKEPFAVPIPEEGQGKVAYILNPTPNESDLAQMQWVAHREEIGTTNVGFSAFLVAWSLADESNNQLLDPGDSETEVNAEFVELMDHMGGPNGMDSRAHKRLSDKAMQAFGLSKSDVEELEKNSEATLTDDGNGSNPNPSEQVASNG